MNKEQVQKHFNSRLKENDLRAGSNYMIDAKDTVWWCEVWVLGGIWFIKEISKKTVSQKEYYNKKIWAELREDTLWEKRK
ncbi:MAG: hypothetical protein E3J94_07255 [Desulfobacteraceae bacterium]|nr:MAG: hypothetical protein E3J94_07255 [Desulfobacteraceae bacterium]